MSATVPLLSMTSSARANRAARVICEAMTARTSSATSPPRPTTRRTRGLGGVRHVDATRRERPRDFGLAAADAAGESDVERRVHPGKNVLTSVRPKNNVTAPATARYGPKASGML